MRSGGVSLLLLLLLPTAHPQRTKPTPLILHACGMRPLVQAFMWDAPSSTLRLRSANNSCVTVQQGDLQSPVVVLSACNATTPPTQNITLLPPFGNLVFGALSLYVDADGSAFAGAPLALQPASTTSSIWAYDAASGLLTQASSSLCMDAGGVPTAHACLTTELRTLLFCNPALSIPVRVADLLGRMSLAEKISLTGSGQFPSTCDTMDPGVERLGIPPHQWLVETNSMAASACFNDTTCATSFPSAQNLAASFNRSVWRAKGDTVSSELRAFNNLGGSRDDGNPLSMIGLSGFGPDINQPRDPRNGRTGELPGEDPMLTGAYAIEYVHGCQEGSDPRYLKMIAGLKHYSAYSLETGRFGSKANISTYDLWDTYLPQFEAGFIEGRASGSMCSYIEINGIPACANEWLLSTVVRSYWGRPDATHTSDCGAVENMYTQNHYVPNATMAAAVSLNAGMDLNSNTILPDNLDAAIKAGYTTEAVLDAALSRTLTMRFRAGIFDPLETQVYTAYGVESIGSAAHLAAAYEGAAQGLVLLKNSNNTLPLRRGAKVAVLGPIAVYPEAMMGDYYADQVCPDPPSGKVDAGLNFYCVPTVADALFLANPTGGNVVAVPGTGITANDSSWGAALAAVNDADAIVLALGIDRTIAYEGTDSKDIGLPAVQVAFALAVSARAANRGIPVILVLINGLPLSIDDLVGPMDAIVEAYTPSFGARAIGEALFGVNRWGRAVMTIYPRDYQNQVSLFDFDMSKSPGRTYRYYQKTPLFRFGQGLTYSNVTVACALSQFEPGADPINLNCNITSVAGPTGDQILMVFHRASVDVVTRIGGKHPVPLSELVEFARIADVPSGGVTPVSFTLAASKALNLVNEDGATVMYPGLHYLDVWDGGQNNVTLSIEWPGNEPAVLRSPPMQPRA